MALGVGTAAVAVLTWDYGRPPYVALVLAFSFGTYGLAKKTAGAGAVESLAFETAVLVPIAGGYLIWLTAVGDSHFTTDGVGHALMLMTAGIVTAIPLICFGAAATRVSMTSLGLLQYLAPVLQFALGLLVFDEDMPVGPLDRLRPGLGGALDLHLRADPPPPPTARPRRRGGCGLTWR